MQNVWIAEKCTTDKGRRRSLGFELRRDPAHAAPYRDSPTAVLAPRLSHCCTCSSKGNDELKSLRSTGTTKTSLESSWKEVEALQRECVDIEAHTVRLEQDLNKARENMWITQECTPDKARRRSSFNFELRRDPLPRLANCCTCSASRISDELKSLRYTSKKSLESAWKEVEALQRECADREAHNVRLEQDLKKARKREVASQHRLADLEKTLRNGIFRRPSMMNMFSDTFSKKNEPFYVTESEKNGNEAEEENKISDVLKIQSRDLALLAMEQMLADSLEQLAQLRLLTTKS